MARTALHPGGYPGRPYGSFAGKAAAATPATRITTLWAYGGPGHLYGSFAGKEASTAGATVTDWLVHSARRRMRR